MTTRKLTCGLVLTLALALPAARESAAQERRGPGGGGGGAGPGLVTPQTGERIAWYGTLALGLAEAQRTGKPILLFAAAPACHGVSGVW